MQGYGMHLTVSAELLTTLRKLVANPHSGDSRCEHSQKTMPWTQSLAHHKDSQQTDRKTKNKKTPWPISNQNLQKKKNDQLASRNSPLALPKMLLGGELQPRNLHPNADTDTTYPNPPWLHSRGWELPSSKAWSLVRN